MTSSGKPILCLLIATAWLASTTAGRAADDSQGDAERMVQAYLAMWSRNDGINAASVARFYAPHVIYYGKSMSRDQVLVDKRAYIRQWPVRSYVEVPGSFAGTCNADRSRCKVKFDMRWRRVSRTSHVVAGRARLAFIFVPAGGGRRIAQESARLF